MSLYDLGRGRGGTLGARTRLYWYFDRPLNLADKEALGTERLFPQQ